MSDAIKLPVSSSVRLRDGRTLGYAVAGDPQGTPLIYFHGTPGARFQFAADEPTALELGIRIVTPERPGYGLSSPARGRTMLSWADDVAELADHLRLERFAVAGASGGGPYVAACAYRIPERLTAAMMLCSPSPVDAPEVRRRLTGLNRIKFLMPRQLWWLLWVDLALAAVLVRRWPRFFARRVAQLSRTDQLAYRDPAMQERLALVLAEGFRQGAEGTTRDLILNSGPWGFPIEEIRIPVHLWHGEEDRMAPVEMGRHLAARIPLCRARILPGVGHVLTRAPGVWREVLEVAAGRCGCAAGAESCAVQSRPADHDSRDRSPPVCPR